jgi:hypothetical protein
LHLTGVAMPGHRRRERWRQLSFNLADGFAAAELESKEMGSKGPQPKDTNRVRSAMPATRRKPTPGGDQTELKAKAASAFAKQDNKSAKPGRSAKPAKRGK